MMKMNEIMTESKLKRLYGQYLEHSIRYYLFDQPVIPDNEFDDICKTLLQFWNQFDHKYKYLTDQSALSAGTGYHISYDNAPPHILDLVRKYPNRPLSDVFKFGDGNE